MATGEARADPADPLMDRLGFALDRADAAAARLAHLAGSHSALRGEVAAALADLDGLIAAVENPDG